MIPDPGIVKRVKRYDRNLFIKWSNQEQFFELWMKRPLGGEVQITPITQSIYDGNAPREFVCLDERLLWWIYNADTHKVKDVKLEFDKNYLNFISKINTSNKSRKDDNIYKAKEIWHGVNNTFMTKYKSKNSHVYPKFNEHKPETKWVQPDARSNISSNLYFRSKQNAKHYNFKG